MDFPRTEGGTAWVVARAVLPQVMPQTCRQNRGTNMTAKGKVEALGALKALQKPTTLDVFAMQS